MAACGGLRPKPNEAEVEKGTIVRQPVFAILANNRYQQDLIELFVLAKNAILIRQGALRARIKQEKTQVRPNVLHLSGRTLVRNGLPSTII